MVVEVAEYETAFVERIRESDFAPASCVATPRRATVIACCGMGRTTWHLDHHRCRARAELKSLLSRFTIATKIRERPTDR
jgi:hypothetical protein